MSRATRARTDVLGIAVERAAALPHATGGSDDLFSTTGQILLTGFWGLVTAAIPNESLDFDIAHDPDSGGADVALATLLAVDNSGVGTWFSFNTTAAGALIAGTDAGYNVWINYPVALTAGDIKLNVAGGGAIGTTARVKWGITYIPLSVDGAVVAV
jgi:hypothetical protein